MAFAEATMKEESSDGEYTLNLSFKTMQSDQ